MASFIHDIHSTEFFLLLFILMLSSIGLQAYVHKKDLTQDDKKFLIHWISKRLIDLSMLVVVLEIIAWVAKE